MRENPTNKSAWREILKERRAALSDERREEASTALLHHLTAFNGYILSFVSLPFEIDTTPINRHLAASGHLLLPKIEGDTLGVYQVDDLTTLKTGPFNLLEPDPQYARRCSLNEIATLLVPGLGFDCERRRLGYGKGFYDRLLKEVQCPTFGIGFQEQAVDLLPEEPHDIRLFEVLLF